MASPSQPSPPAAPSPPCSQPSDSTRVILSQLKRMTLSMTRWQDDMQDQMNQLQSSIYSQFQYQNEYFAALASAHPGIAFAPPPTFPTHSQPPVPSDDDNII